MGMGLMGFGAVVVGLELLVWAVVVFKMYLDKVSCLEEVRLGLVDLYMWPLRGVATVAGFVIFVQIQSPGACRSEMVVGV
jgi:hypothetical protein